MFENTYSISCLSGFKGVHETITCPKKGSLSGKAIEWIEYFDLHSNQVMDGSIGFICSRILAVALPVISLLDFLGAPLKSLYFIAILQPKASLEELKNAVHFLALAIFSTLSIPYALYKPALVYLSESTWSQIKQKHLKEKLKTTFSELVKEKGTASEAEIFTEAVNRTLPKVFGSENSENSIASIIESITEQLNQSPGESTILLEHFHHWTSVFLVACHREKLQIENVDQTFYDFIYAAIRLKNPTLREQMTERIVSDYANGAPVVDKFRTHIESQEAERKSNVQAYLDKETKNKEREKERIQEQIDKTRITLQEKQEEKEPNHRAIAGIKAKLTKLEDSLEDAEKVDDAFIRQKQERANEIYPPFTSNNYAYLSLYFLLASTQYSEELYQVLRAPIFKDCHQLHFLQNFLLLLDENKKHLDVQSFITALNEAHNADNDRKSPNLIQFLKNCTILIQLKEWEKLRNREIPLHSPSIIPELFRSRFKLEAYDGENGNDRFLKDYEKTFAQFRDPTTIMILYSTLSQLQKTEKEKAIEGLTTFVSHTLISEDSLHTYRHDTEKSAHLAKCYELKTDLRDEWERKQFKPLVEGNSDPRYEGYTIGEAYSPCDLAMSSQEVIKSCLHPAGRPKKVKGFLGILLDGKIHPVVIKEPSGKIAARMLLKLLIANDQEPPVLMIDTIYTSSHDIDEIQFFEQKILDYSKDRAEKLGLQLVSSVKKDSQSETTIGPLCSLDSGVPFEHVNAFDRATLTKKEVFGNGEYTIPEVYVVD